MRLKQKNPTKVYRVLGCILSYVIDNYVCIDHLCCHSKTISVVSSAKIFGGTSYIELPCIGIPEMLMNLISYNGFMKKNIYQLY